MHDHFQGSRVKYYNENLAILTIEEYVGICFMLIWGMAIGFPKNMLRVVGIPKTIHNSMDKVEPARPK